MFQNFLRSFFAYMLKKNHIFYMVKKSAPGVYSCGNQKHKMHKTQKIADRCRRKTANFRIKDAKRKAGLDHLTQTYPLILN